MEAAKKVFLSYAREDFDNAVKICSELERSGVTVWMDKKELIPGQNWKMMINQAIKNCSYFLALLSSNSVTKNGEVQKELKIALDMLDEFSPSDIFVIPIRLDNCKSTHEKLQEIHWADLFPSFDAGLKDVLRSLGVEIKVNEEKSAKSILLPNTLNFLHINQVERDYNCLKGYFHFYQYWNRGGERRLGMVRRTLIEVYEFDKKNGLIHCRMKTALGNTDIWTYEGKVIDFKNELFWLFECIKEGDYYPEIITLNILRPSFWTSSDHYLYGITGHVAMDNEYPCAGNIVLEKISNNHKLKDKIGYFSPKDIEAEDHSINILDYIDNKIEDGRNQLTIKTPQ